MFVERDDKPETIKSTATLGRDRIFTDTFIHFLRFMRDKTVELISRDARKNFSLMSKCKLQGVVVSFSLFISITYTFHYFRLLNDITVTK